jgi:leucyl aminopeptidase
MIPTSTDVTITVKSKSPADAQAVAICVPQGAKASEGTMAAAVLGERAANAAGRLLTAGVATGKARQVVFDLADDGDRLTRVIVAGLGSSEQITTESIRQAAAAIVKTVRKQKLSHLAIVPPTVHGIDPPTVAAAIATGVLLAAFSYREYKGSAHSKSNGDDDSESPKHRKLAVTLVVTADQQSAVQSAVDRAIAIADGQNFARTIASRPGNNINPPALAKVAQSLANDVGLGCRIMDEKELMRLGMGGILAVGMGSIHAQPRMIVLEHKARGAGKKTKNQKSKTKNPTLLVVGKAITFDTGGISIKPAEKMGKMIFDKCGGMAVLGLMYAVAKLKLPIHVVGILSSAENAISSKAYRPGDIIRMYNGVTVEVTNTDAEGRLVLGDALAWGIETYKPAAVVDLATLTGGVIVALGKTMAGVMSNNDGLVADLTNAGIAAGEKLWRLPLGDDQRDHIKSDCADIVNSAGRDGHPLQGGAFLSHFIPDDGSVPWAHLDIAGVADTEKELPLYAKGATGWGVRTLVEWVMARIAG